MIKWFKRLLAKFRPRPVYVHKPVDDRLLDCIMWIERNPTGKHYVACRLLSTVQDLQKRFPNATVLTIQRLATGWSTHDENAYLCCTYTMSAGAVAVQLGARLRAANAREHTLIFIRQGARRG